jgi:NADH:ubiquinone oxidoreductase subunit B-like Fe-S oxidoreductase
MWMQFGLAFCVFEMMEKPMPRYALRLCTALFSTPMGRNVIAAS